MAPMTEEHDGDRASGLGSLVFLHLHRVDIPNTIGGICDFQSVDVGWANRKDICSMFSCWKVINRVYACNVYFRFLSQSLVQQLHHALVAKFRHQPDQEQLQDAVHQVFVAVLI